MYNTALNRSGNHYDTNQNTPSHPAPLGGPSVAEGRLGGRMGAPIVAAGGHDDVSGISFGHDEDNRFLNILGAPYSATDDGHGKFTPAPRTRIPRTDHGTPGDNKKKD